MIRAERTKLKRKNYKKKCDQFSEPILFVFNNFPPVYYSSIYHASQPGESEIVSSWAKQGIPDLRKKKRSGLLSTAPSFRL
jgi:hypothetical protein